MPIYEDNPGVSIEFAQSLDRGDPANVSRLELGAHTGTHIDAPRHFIADGASVDELPLERFVGPCIVADATAAVGVIDADLIHSLELPAGTDRVLLKTANSRLWERDVFTRDFIRLDASGANALIERGIRLAGIDYLSIGDADAHVALLTRGIGVVEGLDLRGVDAGRYLFACLPVKIVGCDGAPSRAVLWRV